MVILNSSTSSSEATTRAAGWKTFVSVAAATLIGAVLLCYGFIVLVDPYDNVPFSPEFERGQLTTSQRFFYPALARKQRFDSAIFGNSSIRLLRPDQWNELLGGQFVNLGMNAASAWEQEQIFNVFQRNHAEIRNVVLGMDINWCREKGVGAKFIGSNTAEDFPAWMYDEQTFNNLPRLNSVSLQHASKLLQIVLGIRERRFGADGYTVFTDPESEYDIDKARLNIYGSSVPLQKESQTPPSEMSEQERAEIPFPELDRLRTMLDALPPGTRKILLFTPLHGFRQPIPGSRTEIIWQECKKRTVKMAAAGNKVFVIDFMIQSPITSSDSNYWDPVHYKVEVAERLGKLIGRAVNERQEGAELKLLHAPSVEDG